MVKSIEMKNCRHGVPVSWCAFCRAEQGDEEAAKMLKVFAARKKKPLPQQDESNDRPRKV